MVRSLYRSFHGKKVGGQASRLRMASVSGLDGPLSLRTVSACLLIGSGVIGGGWWPGM